MRCDAFEFGIEFAAAAAAAPGSPPGAATLAKCSAGPDSDLDRPFIECPKPTEPPPPPPFAAARYAPLARPVLWNDGKALPLGSGDLLIEPICGDADRDVEPGKRAARGAGLGLLERAYEPLTAEAMAGLDKWSTLLGMP